MCILGVVDRPLEDGRRGLLGELSAAEMVHERFMHAALGLMGPNERLWAVYTRMFDARGSAPACSHKSSTRCINYHRVVW